MVFAAAYSIFVGFFMIVQWAVTLFKGAVAAPGQDQVSGRGRVEMLFHISAEFICACALITGGIGLALCSPWAKPIYLLASGMLIYTAVNSPGFFAQQGKWGYVSMFAVILILAVLGLSLVLL